MSSGNVAMRSRARLRGAGLAWTSSSLRECHVAVSSARVWTHPRGCFLAYVSQFDASCAYIPASNDGNTAWLGMWMSLVENASEEAAMILRGIRWRWVRRGGLRG